MSAGVLLSVKPKHVRNICTVKGKENGKLIYKKTIDMRKTRPKLKTPFTCYIYQTYGKLHDPFSRKIQRYFNQGKVIGEFICDSIDTIAVYNDQIYAVEHFQSGILQQSCLTLEEIKAYLGVKNKGYAWHISSLKIYDEPKELGEFCTTSFGKNDSCFTCENYPTKENGIDYYSARCNFCVENHELFIKKLTRAPQSWCYIGGQL